MSDQDQLMQLEPDGTLHLYDADGAELITVFPSGAVQTDLCWTRDHALRLFRLAVAKAANQSPTAADAAKPAVADIIRISEDLGLYDEEAGAKLSVANIERAFREWVDIVNTESHPLVGGPITTIPADAAWKWILTRAGA